MKHSENIRQAAMVASLLLVAQTCSFTVGAESCKGHLRYEEYKGHKDGDSSETVGCRSTTNNPPCEVMSYTCYSGLQFTPDPPTHQKICTDGSEETGYKCVINTVFPTVTAYLGRPSCGNPCGSPHCVDWDTSPTEIYGSTVYWWHDDSTSECPEE